MIFLKHKTLDENKLIPVQETSIEDYIKDELADLTPLDIKNMGNAEFQKFQFESAINLYTRGVQKANPDENGDLLTILHGNKCESLLQLRMYEEALVEAEGALKYSPGHPKQTFRKARALVYLDRLDEAIQTFESVPQINDGGQEVQNFLEEH